MATLLVVYSAAIALSGRRRAGVVAALALGSGTTFWAQATTANIRMPTALLAEYVGAYPLRDGLTLDFRLDGDQLMVEATGQGTVPVFAESETDFFLKVAEVTISFTRDSDGIVDGLVFRQGGQTITSKKVR